MIYRVTLAALLLSSVWASAHTLTPPRQNQLMINGATIARFEAQNLMPETRDFSVTVYADQGIAEPLGDDYWNAIPIGFRLGPGESRQITVKIRDDGDIKKVWVCTETTDFNSEQSTIGVRTRVCSFIRLFRPGDFAVRSPSE